MLRYILLFFLIVGTFQNIQAQDEEETPVEKPKKEKKEKSTKEKKTKRSKEPTNEPESENQEATPHIQIELKNYLTSPGLTLHSKKTLDDLLSILPGYSDLILRVEGHTSNFNFLEDREESLEEGQDRSQKQADIIKDYLINKGFNSEMISAEGFGASRPKIVGYHKKDKPIYLENNTKFAQMSNERIILQIELQFMKDFEALSKELRKKDILFKAVSPKQ